MKDFTDKNFGLIIAFWLPGFSFLWGVAYVSNEAKWLQLAEQSSSPSIGGFLYTTVASLALGLLISGVRWASIDQVMPHCWVPPFNESIFLGTKDQLATFALVVEGHYRFYQFYANTLVSIAGVAVYAVVTHRTVPVATWVTAGAALVVLFLAARDAMAKYCRRTQKIIDQGKKEAIS